MNKRFFSVKRLYWRLQMMQRAVAEPLGLTPARFDVLVAIRRGKGDLCQRALRDYMDCNASTLSEMLKVLMKEKLVTSLINGIDRRYRVLNLTRLGRQLALFAEHEVCEANLDFKFDCLVKPEIWMSAEATATAVAAFEAMVVRIRRRLGCRGCLYDVWPRDSVSLVSPPEPPQREEEATRRRRGTRKNVIVQLPPDLVPLTQWELTMNLRQIGD